VAGSSDIGRKPAQPTPRNWINLAQAEDYLHLRAYFFEDEDAAAAVATRTNGPKWHRFGSDSSERHRAARCAGLHVKCSRRSSAIQTSQPEMGGLHFGRVAHARKTLRFRVKETALNTASTVMALAKLSTDHDQGGQFIEGGGACARTVKWMRSGPAGLEPAVRYVGLLAPYLSDRYFDRRVVRPVISSASERTTKHPCRVMMYRRCRDERRVRGNCVQTRA
jgi:hypothetical protein